jgi:putative ABC transport system permease protein
MYLVRTINPGNIPRLEVIGIDGAVLAFTFGVSILTGIVFGLAPAFRAVNVDLNTSLKSGGRSTQGDGGFIPRGAACAACSWCRKWRFRSCF